MPKGSPPPELLAFLAEPRAAVIATVSPAGQPVTAATWYGLDGDRLLLAMDVGGRRARHLRANPRLSLTVLDDDWYNQVSLIAHVVELREDPQLADIDALSQRYVGTPYEDRTPNSLTAIAVIDSWHTFGNPGASPPTTSG